MFSINTNKSNIQDASKLQIDQGTTLTGLIMLTVLFFIIQVATTNCLKNSYGGLNIGSNI